MTVESELRGLPLHLPPLSPVLLSHPLSALFSSLCDPAFFFSFSHPPSSFFFFYLSLSVSPLPFPPLSILPRPPRCVSSKLNLCSLSRRVLHMQKAGSCLVYACVCVLFAAVISEEWGWVEIQVIIWQTENGKMPPDSPHSVQSHRPNPPNPPAADAAIVMWTLLLLVPPSRTAWWGPCHF